MVDLSMKMFLIGSRLHSNSLFLHTFVWACILQFKSSIVLVSLIYLSHDFVDSMQLVLLFITLCIA